MLSLVDELLQYREPDCPLPFDRSQIQGYSEAELLEISQNYNLSIHGDFRRLLLEMGRCSGGLLWDFNVDLYEPSSTPNWYRQVQNIWADESVEGHYMNSRGSQNPIKRQMFVLARVAETYRYLLFTDDNSVWWYDENESFVEVTYDKFMDYLIFSVQENNKIRPDIPMNDEIIKKYTRSCLL